MIKFVRLVNYKNKFLRKIRSGGKIRNHGAVRRQVGTVADPTKSFCPKP